MQTLRVVVASPHGLHAQACAGIVQIAESCRCKLSLIAKGRRVSARNIMAIMLLTATVGATVRIEADGPDEISAIRDVAALFHDGFGERR
jgi:phosphocarrier protein HPr